MTTPYYQPYWTSKDFLEHHGVKGQSWGDRNGPPYPLSRGKDGRITQGQKKKKQSFLTRMKSEHQKKVKAKQRAKAREAKKKEAEKDKKEEMSKEELRAKLLTSNDPKFIAKHMDLLETKEIKERLDRIETEKKVKNLLKDDKAKKKVDKAMEWVNHVKTISEATSKAAGAYTAVYNASQLKDKRQAEKEADRDNRDAVRSLITAYSKNADNLADIKVDFDSKTGKLTFQTISTGKKDKNKGSD